MVPTIRLIQSIPIILLSARIGRKQTAGVEGDGLN